ncbi:hypothetical protein O0I10_004951 [Lichtheimia ornata]|uniref:Uncharacterized protein n=1 Tax=Lichtheimia ornata TaxID=688661 RepID=A0AAD7V799_9FUNG|nr:uncharacterized protein O0I10_004951 [Lichtheimia ornata]KAJ8659237.1 hypothetical protein O0I10_004951 [Lichtheimia ornata]
MQLSISRQRTIILFLSLLLQAQHAWGAFSASMDCSDPCTVRAGDSIPIQWVDAPPNEMVSAWLVWQSSLLHHTSSFVDVPMDDTDGAAGRGEAKIDIGVATGDYYYLRVQLKNHYNQDQTLGPIRIIGSNDTTPSSLITPETWQVRPFCYEPCSGGYSKVHSGDWLRLEMTGIPESTTTVTIELVWDMSTVTTLLFQEPVKDEMFVMIPWDEEAPPGDFYYISVLDGDNYGYRTASTLFSITNEVALSNPGYTPEPVQQFITPVTQIPDHLLNDGKEEEGNAPTGSHPRIVFSSIMVAVVVALVSCLIH